MAYISHNNLWESDFDNIVSTTDKMQDVNRNQLKHEVHDTYKKDEKITTNFRADKDDDVTNKDYLVKKYQK